MAVKILFMFVGISGVVGVCMGAFGAHAVKGKISASLLSAFETGVSYQMTHTLAIFGVCVLIELWGPKPGLLIAGFALMIGIVLFSGSLYGLALTEQRWLGPVTPLGGLSLISGWIALCYVFWNHTFGSIN